MRVLDLFSGIGGFSLGLERAGMQTVAFCEIDPYCRAVLRKHWPEVPCYEDVRTLSRTRLARDGIIDELADTEGEQDRRIQPGGFQTNTGTKGIDVICGGFPCQDISMAGKGAGIEGNRSGLWSEYARLIGELRPRCAIVENVAALLGRGLERVLGDLAALGYDAEWHCIPASAVGAPHRRDRIWIVAYPGRERDERGRGQCGGPETSGPCGRATRSSQHAINVADTGSERLPLREMLTRVQEGTGCTDEGQNASVGSWWATEPTMGELVDGVSGGLVRFDGRVASGVQDRVSKLKALGNAVVPAIPEILGMAIIACERERSALPCVHEEIESAHENTADLAQR
jgi:DNA (cytosine-5)-methyltransferase 1